MPFIAIKELRDLVRTSFRVTSRGERDILVDLAAAQQLGQCLTMKQLVILQAGSATTTRRRLNSLIESGKVQKYTNPQDGRSEVYAVASAMVAHASGFESEMKRILTGFDKRTHKSTRSAMRTKTKA
jgi:DNA-binding MarR family transcriptional regulator